MVGSQRYLLFNSIAAWVVLGLFVLYALVGVGPPNPSGARVDGPASSTGFQWGYRLGPIIIGLFAAAGTDLVVERLFGSS